MNLTVLSAMSNFLSVGGQVITAPTQVFLVDMPIKQLTGTDEYFDRLGWGELPQVRNRRRITTATENKLFLYMLLYAAHLLQSRRISLAHVVTTVALKTPKHLPICFKSGCKG